MKNKRAVISEYLPWVLIAVAILVLVVLSVFVLKQTGVSLIDKIKNILRIGR